MISESELEQILNNEIPITKSLGISVESIYENKVCLKAPLENNINHKLTAFGGSLYSVTVLTGWSMVYLLLKRLNIEAHIVIQHSEIDYLIPVKEDFIACCEVLSDTKVNKFLKVYKRKGRARLMLDVTVMMGDQRAVHFSGDYVVHK